MASLGGEREIERGASLNGLAGEEKLLLLG